MSEFNILFSAAGRRVSLIRHFKKTLYEMGITGAVLLQMLVSQPRHLLLLITVCKFPECHHLIIFLSCYLSVRG